MILSFTSIANAGRVVRLAPPGRGKDHERERSSDRTKERDRRKERDASPAVSPARAQSGASEPGGRVGPGGGWGRKLVGMYVWANFWDLLRARSRREVKARREIPRPRKTPRPLVRATFAPARRSRGRRAKPPRRRARQTSRQAAAATGRTARPDIARWNERFGFLDSQIDYLRRLSARIRQTENSASFIISLIFLYFLID